VCLVYESISTKTSRPPSLSASAPAEADPLEWDLIEISDNGAAVDIPEERIDCVAVAAGRLGKRSSRLAATTKSNWAATVHRQIAPHTFRSQSVVCVGRPTERKSTDDDNYLGCGSSRSAICLRTATSVTRPRPTGRRSTSLRHAHEKARVWSATIYHRRDGSNRSRDVMTSSPGSPNMTPARHVSAPDDILAWFPRITFLFRYTQAWPIHCSNSPTSQTRAKDRCAGWQHCTVSAVRTLAQIIGSFLHSCPP